MASNNQEIYDHLVKTMDEDVANRRNQLQQWVKAELDKKRFVGTPSIQQTARENENNRLNNIAQTKLQQTEVKLEALYFKHLGGTKEKAQEILGLEQNVSQYNQASGDPNLRYTQDHHLDNAKSDLKDQWQKNQDKGNDLGMDK